MKHILPFIAVAALSLSSPATADFCVIDESDIKVRKNGERSFMDRAGACLIAQGTVIQSSQSTTDSAGVKAAITVIHPEYGMASCTAKQKKADQYVICTAKPWLGE